VPREYAAARQDQVVRFGWALAHFGEVGTIQFMTSNRQRCRLPIRRESFFYQLYVIPQLRRPAQDSRVPKTGSSAGTIGGELVLCPNRQLCESGSCFILYKREGGADRAINVTEVEYCCACSCASDIRLAGRSNVDFVWLVERWGRRMYRGSGCTSS